MNTLLTQFTQTGLIDTVQADLLQRQLDNGVSLMEAVRSSGVTEEPVLRHLAQELGWTYVELGPDSVTKDFLTRFPARVLLDNHILPIPAGQNGDVLAVIADPFETSAVDELRLATGQDFQLGLAPKSDIVRMLKGHLGVGADSVQSMISEAEDSALRIIDQDTDEDMDLSANVDEAPIIRFVNQILTEAIELRATDVHIEPFENELRVRYRIDGVLQETSVSQAVKQFQPAIISRLKILAKLDIAEKRVPQDGRLKLRLKEREVDVRVSIIPMLYGEAIVLRLLDRGSVLFGLDKLGMSPRDMELMEGILTRPHGIILVTGPTGSGKTTTLYGSLAKINDIGRKIITIEDPIEYQLHGINQIQVSRKAGLTFASGLRAILRHDPDVVLIGEIRDVETAEIAVQASLTGHLVFSTLHTNDAPSALTRLVDMGVEPYLVASSLEAVIAQRLVRQICSHCREEMPASEVDKLRNQFTQLPDTLYRGKGCRQCQGTGYRGRQGIFEMMVVTEDIRNSILENPSSRLLRKMATQDGMVSLRQDGYRYLESGLTTIQEILRVTKDEQMEHYGQNGRNQ